MWQVYESLTWCVASYPMYIMRQEAGIASQSGSMPRRNAASNTLYIDYGGTPGHKPIKPIYSHCLLILDQGQSHQPFYNLALFTTLLHIYDSCVHMVASLRSFIQRPLYISNKHRGANGNVWRSSDWRTCSRCWVVMLGCCYWAVMLVVITGLWCWLLLLACDAGLRWWVAVVGLWRWVAFTGLWC